MDSEDFLNAAKWIHQPLQIDLFRLLHERFKELRITGESIPEWDLFLHLRWILIIEDLGHTRIVSLHSPDRPIKLH